MTDNETIIDLVRRYNKTNRRMQRAEEQCEVWKIAAELRTQERDQAQATIARLQDDISKGELLMADCIRIWVFEAAPANYQALIAPDEQEYTAYLAIIPKDMIGDCGKETGFAFGLGNGWRQALPNGDILIAIG